MSKTRQDEYIFTSTVLNNEVIRRIGPYCNVG